MPSFSTILLKRLIAFSRFSESSTKIVAIVFSPPFCGVPSSSSIMPKIALLVNIRAQSMTNIFERLESRQKIEETDLGHELQQRIADLRALLEAYRAGAVPEDHSRAW